MFVHHFSKRLFAADIAVASPDIGGVKRVQIFRELLERRLGRAIEIAFIEKRRTGGVATSGRVVGEVSGREVIVLDDLCATGGTLIRAAEVLRGSGAAAVHVAFTHAPLPKGLAALAAADSIAQIVLTDSVDSLRPDILSAGNRLSVLPIAPLFAQAVTRMLTGAPLAPLLDSWPPSDST
jgi:ribose-phosphate pyrophosphokinase